MAQLHNKVIAITGAASGIGHATALEAAARGASLALSDINETLLNELVTSLSAQSIPVIGHKVDVSSSSSVNTWIDNVIQHYGRLDGAANIAGVESAPNHGKVFADITDITDEHWDYILGINLTGTFYCMRAELRVMTSGASIMNVASLAGVMGRPGLGAYSTSKHGVVGLTRTAAKEQGPKGIRVNVLAPGPVETPMLARLTGDAGSTDRPVTSTYKNIPLGRLGSVADMARTICFVLSEDASWTTGMTFSVDGGVAC